MKLGLLPFPFKKILTEPSGLGPQLQKGFCCSNETQRRLSQCEDNDSGKSGEKWGLHLHNVAKGKSYKSYVKTMPLPLERPYLVVILDNFKFADTHKTRANTKFCWVNWQQCIVKNSTFFQDTRKICNKIIIIINYIYSHYKYKYALPQRFHLWSLQWLIPICYYLRNHQTRGNTGNLARKLAVSAGEGFFFLERP